MRLTNRPKLYSPDRIAKYAVDDNQTWTLKMPRRTSDHLNRSSRSRTGLHHSQNWPAAYFLLTHLNLSSLADCVCPCSRCNAKSFSSLVRYDAPAMLVGRSRYATAAATTVFLWSQQRPFPKHH